MSDYQAPPPPSGYPQGYPGYPIGYPVGYPPPLPEHPQGTTVLVLGILSLLTGVVAPFAWYFGSKTEKEIKASGLRYNNESQIQIGKILGIVGTVILGITVLIIIGYFAFFLAIFLPLMTQMGR